MSKLKWDQTGEKKYETGVDHGVVFPQTTSGSYDAGVAWNGLTAVNESPSGAEAEKQYADNMVYLTLVSAEELGLTIEAFMSPEEFDVCDGTASPATGVSIGQQTRRKFGFAYRTIVGNDTELNDYGYKLHLVYNCLAAPSEKEHGTVNESPEAQTLSWEVSTEPVALTTVNPDTNKVYKPTAQIIIDSTKVDATKLAEFEDILYGTDAGSGSTGTAAQLLDPDDVIAFFAGSSNP